MPDSLQKTVLRYPQSCQNFKYVFQSRFGKKTAAAVEPKLVVLKAETQAEIAKASR